VFVPAALPTVIRLVGDGDHAWPILVVTFTPTALPVLAALTVGALASRRWRIGIAGALAVALNVVWLAPLYVADTPPVGTDLVAMTTNIQYGWGKPAEIVAAVRDRHVDLLAVEELTPEAVTGLGAAGLDALLPYRVVAPGTLAHGSGLWSRFPLTPGEAWDGVHHMPGATVHIPADGGVRDVIVRVAHPYRTARYNATSYRRDQSMLRERMAALPRDVPAIVLGDFNASRDHAAFRRYLGDGWRDAPEVAGSGLIPTWSPRYWIPPLVQLDHILISRQFGARSASAFDIDGSDHQALVARLVLARTV
jgi:endonuclease/exonuclease/phosphatase family metal-dependent hydrolase